MKSVHILIAECEPYQRIYITVIITVQIIVVVVVVVVVHGSGSRSGGHCGRVMTTTMTTLTFVTSSHSANQCNWNNLDLKEHLSGIKF